MTNVKGEGHIQMLLMVAFECTLFSLNCHSRIRSYPVAKITLKGRPQIVVTFF